MLINDADNWLGNIITNLRFLVVGILPRMDQCHEFGIADVKEGFRMPIVKPWVLVFFLRILVVVVVTKDIVVITHRCDVSMRAIAVHSAVIVNFIVCVIVLLKNVVIIRVCSCVAVI